MFPFNSTSQITNRICITTTLTQQFRITQYIWLHLRHQSQREFCLWCMQRCAEAGLSWFIRRGSTGPRSCMWSVGLPSRPPLCRSLSLPMNLKTWHKWWFLYNLGLQIKIKRKVSRKICQRAAKTTDPLLMPSAKGIGIRVTFY